MYSHENELASARFEFDDNYPKDLLKVGSVVLASRQGMTKCSTTGDDCISICSGCQVGSRQINLRYP
jgi:hypothetical protein